MALMGLLVKVLGLGALFIISQYVLAYLQSPLKKIPGPFLAKFSDIWRFLNHYGQTHIETQRKLHEQHGDIVRLGPNTVSVADQSLIKTIYNTRGTFLKNIFSTRSNEFHSKSVRPVQKLYSLQNALQIESIMNDNLRTLCAQLETRFVEGANKGKTCDIADWISFFAYDFLGDMTWSKRIGFTEKGEDIDDMFVGQIPHLDKWLGKNPKWPRSLYKFDDFAVAAGFSVERFMERMQNPELGNGKNDFLNGFLEAKKEFPELVTDNEVIGYMIINVLGGADTLAIVIKAIFYHILKSPAAKARLVQELLSAHLSYPAPYKTIEQLPYLDACIKEGLRMHPVVGHILERVVPATGLTLSNGITLPPGTIVGVNPWVMHYKESIFGAQPHTFRPERWMRDENEEQAVYDARIKNMKEADMVFGGGNRICLGKPLALVEVYKVVATLFAKYKIDLEDANKEWDLHKQWFVWPHDIRVKLSPLESAP
ncbi:benzoate 4-monooxygenase cytochrome p450 [Pyrenophora tritici-repentis]|nr:benzoate 4-monooxygenase cytochrome p450 [Pyrenophora tritici-repentis]KAI0627474.1 benzoate 4-monooxygenase cytochrome p450 [Pyrenophora tritici-repentis]